MMQFQILIGTKAMELEGISSISTIYIGNLLPFYIRYN